MRAAPLEDTVRAMPYPGRGIVMGICAKGDTALIAYFVTGRSAGSRARALEAHGDGSVHTVLAGEEALKNKSLLIYAAMRRVSDTVVVTNGDHTDTVYDALLRGESFEDALARRQFEPDAPIYTPRIAGCLKGDEEGFSYKLAILKAGDGCPKAPQRFFFHYPATTPGVGHLICTYGPVKEDGVPQAFEGEPLPVILPADIDELGETLWRALDKDNKVSVLVCGIGRSGKWAQRIFNQNGQ